MKQPLRYRRPHPGTQPEYNYPPYASTQKRCPTQPLVVAPQTLSELTIPDFGYGDINPTDNDLTHQHRGEPIGERIVVSGRVLDENGKAGPHPLVEVWQATSSGRYPHRTDQHDAPLDPNFSGAGRTLTDAEGRYRFVSIRPGEYPWRNHYNAWRPAHIHFSLFGQAFLTRMVTQMYFPGDPLLELDPMYNCSASETVGPYLHIGLNWLVTRSIAGASVRGERVTIQGRLLDGNRAGVNDGM